MDKSFEIAELIYKKIRNTIDQEELGILEQWIGQSEENRKLFDRLTDPSVQLEKLELSKQFRKEKTWSAIEAEVFGPPTRSFNTTRFLRIAAAILLPVIVTAGFLIVLLGRTGQPQMANIDEHISPGSSQAILVLADGEQKELEQDLLPSDFSQEGAEIRNENNSLRYKGSSGTSRRKRQVFNELRTPRGGGYNLVLADGTEVWLNAGSSLTFPVNFTDTVRRVFLDGEAYFDVSHSGDPFVVSTGSMDIRVLGTSFNIMAYEDESDLVTTLVEGKVRIQLKGDDGNIFSSQVLNPSDQARASRLDRNISISQVNTAQYTSWVEGKFEFDNEDLETVLRRLARWYDFDYEFENAAAREYHFSARISNTEKISSILEMLEMTTEVKFELKENTIVVI